MTAIEATRMSAVRGKSAVVAGNYKQWIIYKII
jgi:hypothetical protein